MGVEEGALEGGRVHVFYVHLGVPHAQCCAMKG